MEIHSSFYMELSERSLKGEIIDKGTCDSILTSPEVELLSLLQAAYVVRKKYFGKEVALHVINNVQNGHCTEDCHYCAQSSSSRAKIVTYPMKKDEEILEEARKAYESGAFRYCMVFSGKTPSLKKADHLAQLVQRIKSRYPIEVCLSPGTLKKEELIKLKAAGLDRLNHNLNTSERYYGHICSTHTFGERLKTLKEAREAGLEVCSGLIIGMGESPQDIIEVALQLRTLSVRSIPVNFLIPIEGNRLTLPVGLNPQYCLRVLALFRLLNPDAEIRAAGGREGHLGSLEALCLYPANSLFVDGYLNTKGANNERVVKMIQDAGFKIRASIPVSLSLQEEKSCSFPQIAILL